MPEDTRIGPFDTGTDTDFASQYAQALNDDNRIDGETSAIPPLAIATRIFQAQLAAMDGLLTSELREAVTGGLVGVSGGSVEPQPLTLLSVDTEFEIRHTAKSDHALGP